MLQRSTFVMMIVSLTFSLASVPPTNAQTAVTSCGQVIDGDAYLSGDLNCGSGTEAAVHIHSGGSLDLRGFTIHGGEYGVLCAADEQMIGGNVVFPYAPCRVFGGGTIEGQSVFGIDASQLDLADVTISSDSIAIIVHNRLSFTNLTLQLGGPTAVGIEAGKARLAGSGLALTGGGVGIQGGRVAIDGITASGYGTFATSYDGHLKLGHASLTGGTGGIAGARRVTLLDSTATGHSGTGVYAAHITLVRSDVSGNGLDLEADSRPRLQSSTCQTSNGWDVCTNDGQCLNFQGAHCGTDSDCCGSPSPDEALDCDPSTATCQPCLAAGSMCPKTNEGCCHGLTCPASTLTCS